MTPHLSRIPFIMPTWPSSFSMERTGPGSFPSRTPGTVHHQDRISYQWLCSFFPSPSLPQLCCLLSTPLVLPSSFFHSPNKQTNKQTMFLLKYPVFILLRIILSDGACHSLDESTFGFKHLLNWSLTPTCSSDFPLQSYLLVGISTRSGRLSLWKFLNLL